MGGGQLMASLLERARERARERRERQVTIPIHELSMELVCDVPTDMASVERLQNAAKSIDRKAAATHFARALVANQVREIRIDGETLLIDGEPVAFRDPALQRDLGTDAKGAVTALIGADGDVLAVASELMDTAGFTADGDPT